MRDSKIRQAFHSSPRYHRLDVEFDEAEPRLDDTESIPNLKLKAREDDSITSTVSSIARCIVASLFYFELESVPEKIDGKFVGIGYIQCTLRRTSPAFPLLLSQLSSCASVFYLDDSPIPGTFGDNSFLSPDGNFRKRVELNVSNRFAVTLGQGCHEKNNISGSPYLIEGLIRAQGLDAYLGTAYHRKRKRIDGEEEGAGSKVRKLSSFAQS
jgi:hypothetical protein